MPKSKGRKSTGKMPNNVAPMLCTRTPEVIQNEDYLYEVKWDGYRVMSYVQDGKVSLRSRSQLDYTSKYPVVTNALARLGHNAIIDGEIVVLDDDNRPSFDLLQAYRGDRPIQYYCFDLLWLDGADLTHLPLAERKDMLRQIVPASDILRYSEHFDDGSSLFARMKELGMEGIVAKRRQSRYKPGERGNDWLKIQTDIRGEYVIGGWTESTSSRPFRSLLFGLYDGDRLVWVGHSGGGWKDKEMPAILAKLKPLEVKKKPFVNDVKTETRVHWVRPELVANFTFATFTRSGQVRKPAIWLGWRSDKKPKDVVKQQDAATNTLTGTAKHAALKPVARKPALSRTSNWRMIDDAEITSKDSIVIEGCTVPLTNVERNLWEGVTKADLISYYHQVSQYILPHLSGRPLSLHIKNLGPTAPGFYIKDMEGRQPGCAEIFTTVRKHKKAGARNVIDYLVCNNKATLLWLANLGCIDMNPWVSRTSNAEQPDYIIVDLDPSDDDFSKAVAAARAAKKVFDRYKLTAFPKTSGKSGIHLYVPCRGYSYGQARAIAELLCIEVHHQLPDITTTEVSVAARGDKLYLDPNQNDYADTVAAPYSARPWHLPTVSTPLEWREVNSKLRPEAFSIHTILPRLKKKGELFALVNSNAIAEANSKQLRKVV